MADKPNDTAASAAQQPISKSDAVRKILEKFGKKISPKDIAAECKKLYGLDIKPDYAGKIKTETLARGGKKATPRKAPAKQSSPEAEKPAPVKNGKPAPVHMEDILALKSLVKRLGGSEQVKALLGVFDN